MEKEFFTSKKKMFQYLLLSVPMDVVFIVFMILYWNENTTFFRIISVFTVLIFTFVPGILVLRLFQNEPFLKISSEGVYYRQGLSKFKFIHWDDVDSACIIDFENADLLSIYYTKQLSDEINHDNLNRDRNVNMKIFTASLPQSLLETPIIEIMDLMPVNKHINRDFEFPTNFLLSKKELDEDKYLSKIKRIGWKTRKGKRYGTLKHGEVILYFPYLIDHHIKELGSYSYITSSSQYTLWAAIDTLREAKSVQFLELAEKLDQIRHSNISINDKKKECFEIDKLWSESEESILTLTMNYYNYSLTHNIALEKFRNK